MNAFCFCCYRIEVEETQVDGSFSMMFLGHSISLGYRNHTNILMRYSSLQFVISKYIIKFVPLLVH